MIQTEYSWMTSEDLVAMTLSKESTPAIVVELAQRLAFYLEEFRKEVACSPQKDE